MDRLDELKRAFDAPLDLSEISQEVPPPAGKPEAYDCIMPVPSHAPIPNHCHRDHGDPSAVWSYRDASGALIGYIARYDPSGGKKQFAPQTLWGKGGLPKWLRKKWPGLQPLYGLDRLSRPARRLGDRH